MTNVQIRHVPEHVHDVFRRRAAEAGQSLQEYLLGVLIREAESETVDEVLARLAVRRARGLRSDEIVRAIRADRDAG
jgi:plasmid stability protein